MTQKTHWPSIYQSNNAWLYWMHHYIVLIKICCSVSSSQFFHVQFVCVCVCSPQMVHSLGHMSVVEFCHTCSWNTNAAVPRIIKCHTNTHAWDWEYTYKHALLCNRKNWKIHKHERNMRDIYWATTTISWSLSLQTSPSSSSPTPIKLSSIKN